MCLLLTEYVVYHFQENIDVRSTRGLSSCSRIDIPQHDERSIKHGVRSTFNIQPGELAPLLFIHGEYIDVRYG